MPRSTAPDISYLAPDAAKDLTNALSRAEGHIGAIKRMVEERRCCDEILTQFAAVKAALNGAAMRMVNEELLACLSTCGKAEAEKRFTAAMKALSSMIKQG